jgi:DNA polymerase-3 subunit delta
MVFSRKELWGQLERGEMAPAYLLFGPETHLRDLAAKAIADHAFYEGDLRDFNEASFSLTTENNLTKALAAAEQLPMMASRRVIRVTDVRISATGFRDTLAETHESILSAYLSDPARKTVLILIADELNGVRKMGKFLRERTVAVEFARLDDEELARWARKEIKGLDVEIDDAALRFLLMRVDSDVRRLANEINKLASAAMPERRITPELIETLVPSSRELRNFDLTDHLVAGRRSQAMQALSKILDDGTEPLALLGLISYNFRRLLIAKELMTRSVPRSEIASAVKLFGRGQDEFLAAARRADPMKLSYAVKKLAAADIAIKTSQAGGGPIGTRMQLEMLVCELALL